jgi:hypothetical protein
MVIEGHAIEIAGLEIQIDEAMTARHHSLDRSHNDCRAKRSRKEHSHVSSNIGLHAGVPVGTACYAGESPARPG